MDISEIKANAYAMPLISPAFPRGPYHFVNREFLIITYRTDLDALRAVVPEPLEISEPLVKFEFIRMPDSSGFGDDRFAAGDQGHVACGILDRALFERGADPHVDHDLFQHHGGINHPDFQRVIATHRNRVR